MLVKLRAFSKTMSASSIQILHQKQNIQAAHIGLNFLEKYTGVEKGLDMEAYLYRVLREEINLLCIWQKYFRGLDLLAVTLSAR